MKRLLDLFCGAGGAGMGYSRAGFEVVGVDIRPQPRYPFAFVQADALEYLAQHGHEFDAIHASPPCQGFSVSKTIQKNAHADQLTPCRQILLALGKPFVIENVSGAPMQAPAIQLCGLMFALKVFRHRWFESNVMLFAPAHPSHRGKRIGRDGYCCVAGHGDQGTANLPVPLSYRNKPAWSKAMGIDWMNKGELVEAIPPAYTSFVGKQLRDILN